MDTWNPIIEETHVKRVPFWQALLAKATAVLLVVALAWIAAVLFLSLERGAL